MIEVITMRDISKNIRAMRTAKNMTQDELAEKLYVTRQTVSNYETGKSRPDVEMLTKIAEVLDTDINTLIYGLPTPPSRRKEYLLTAGCVIVVLIHWAVYSYLLKRFDFIARASFGIRPTVLLMSI